MWSAQASLSDLMKYCQWNLLRMNFNLTRYGFQWNVYLVIEIRYKCGMTSTDSDIFLEACCIVGPKLYFRWKFLSSEKNLHGERSVLKKSNKNKVLFLKFIFNNWSVMEGNLPWSPRRGQEQFSISNKHHVTIEFQ